MSNLLQTCPCNGGQSCIVIRRQYGDWVHEDDVMRQANLPLRKDCDTEPTDEQISAMENWMNAHNNPDSIIR